MLAEMGEALGRTGCSHRSTLEAHSDEKVPSVGLFCGNVHRRQCRCGAASRGGLGRDATIVTVMCDTGMKYLKTYGAKLTNETI
jgi:cysteine synthase